MSEYNFDGSGCDVSLSCKHKDPSDKCFVCQFGVLKSRLSQAEAERDRYKAALTEIRDQDYRGNRCSCEGIAYKALSKPVKE